MEGRIEKPFKAQVCFIDKGSSGFIAMEKNDSTSDFREKKSIFSIIVIVHKNNKGLHEYIEIRLNVQPYDYLF